MAGHSIPVSQQESQSVARTERRIMQNPYCGGLLTKICRSRLVSFTITRTYIAKLIPAIVVSARTKLVDAFDSNVLLRSKHTFVQEGFWVQYGMNGYRGGAKRLGWETWRGRELAELPRVRCVSVGARLRGATGLCTYSRTTLPR